MLITWKKRNEVKDSPQICTKVNSRWIKVNYEVEAVRSQKEKKKRQIFNDLAEGVYKHRNSERNHTGKGGSFLTYKSWKLL